ncbi:hypothetical protein ACFFOM_03830 [Microlunatus capsulatus]|uniref:Uncharacterized protein n=1 Tax=Microlunatus capsulatus TaxID=99117 RepID=A0ABS4Z4H3_9ACTN|nr:hypothetical protein [Microlunatus capsulatus]MBP2415138.1 hypothetical protein [Microlunatus capsulatus]
MDPMLLVILGVLGYLLAGAVTARVLWHLRHETVAGPRDTAAVLLGWPLVLAIAGGTWAVDGVHQLVTRPTSEERLEQQREALQRRIRQLERDLDQAVDDTTALADPVVPEPGRPDPRRPPADGG